MPFRADSKMSLFIYGHTENLVSTTPLALSDGILADRRVAVLLRNLIYSYTSLYPPVQPLWRLNYLEHFKPAVRSAVLSWAGRVTACLKGCL